jgi:hypothetical protein
MSNIFVGIIFNNRIKIIIFLDFTAKSRLLFLLFEFFT